MNSKRRRSREGPIRTLRYIAVLVNVFQIWQQHANAIRGLTGFIRSEQ